MQNIDTNTLNILLWGNTGVGKTQFIDSFFRELYIYDYENNIRFDPHKIIDDQSNHISTIWNQVSPSEELHDEYFVINREKVINNIPQYLTRYHLRIYDAKGADMINFLNTPVDTLFDSIFKDVFGVIALFTPEQFENEKECVNVIDVFHQLSKRLTKKRSDSPLYLAVCMNKIDKTHIRWNDPEIVFNMFLGNNWNQFSKYNLNKYLRIKYFLTSAFGFCYSSNHTKEFPNRNETDKILCPEAWRPWNVTAPFFWMFSKLESQDMNDFPKPFF